MLRLEAFLDVLRSGRAREVRAPYEPVQIEPATGEAKAVLEASCQAILKKEALDSDDLNLLSKNMVELLGGTKDYLGQLISNPLTDSQRPATIRFMSHVQYRNLFGAAVAYDGHEESFSYDDFGDFIHLSVADAKLKARTYSSYFEGKKTRMFLEDIKWVTRVVGGPTSAKPFFQKAFEVYQASQQPAK